MARIAFILLCHKDVAAIASQARRLTATGDSVTIHFDARAPQQDWQHLRKLLDGVARVAFATPRAKCGWGEWSLVAATLAAVRTARAAFPDSTHFYMLSGDCMPIKSARWMHDFLDAESADYVESFDYFNSGWIKTGLREERLIYRHFTNERNNKRLFYAILDAQKRLGLKRALPRGLRIMIGSQWWCLRAATIDAIMRFLADRPDVTRFFRTTWIPDETFFQTLVRHLVPEAEIRTRTLTFLMFTDYGMPATFHDDHYDMLLGQDYFFARKISPHAQRLKARLGAVFASDRSDFPISGEGRRLFSYVTTRGRNGRRFAPRFWEVEASLGRDRTLLMIACKKWHIGKRLADRIEAALGIRQLAYLFDEEATALPDLGGIEATLEKRARHRRALMRMLYDVAQTDRLLICLDPASFHLIEDFSSDRATSRVLELDCDMSDSFLAGHARRIGLAGENTSAAMLAQLIPTLRNDIREESARIRDAGLAELHRLREGAGSDDNAAELAGFLRCDRETAAALLTDDLFAD